MPVGASGYYADTSIATYDKPYVQTYTGGKCEGDTETLGTACSLGTR